MKKIFPVFIVVILGFCSFIIAHKDKHPNVHKTNKEKQIQPEPFAFLELYTSEGCSSCPGAYKVTSDILTKYDSLHKKVYLLDFHVDYFNNKEFEDPFSSAENTARQKMYAPVFPSAGQYTPQMIINGCQEMAGMAKNQARETIDSLLNIQPHSGITVTDARFGKKDSIILHFKTTNINKDQKISIALIQKTIVRKVTAGENAGKTLTHHNVVRYFTTLKPTKSRVSIPFPKTFAEDKTGFGIVAFYQESKTLKILAATSVDVK